MEGMERYHETVIDFDEINLGRDYVTSKTDDVSPAFQDARPFIDDATGFENDEQPHHNDATSFPNDAKPYCNDVRPFGDDTSPDKDEASPGSNDVSPVWDVSPDNGYVNSFGDEISPACDISPVANYESPAGNFASPVDDYVSPEGDYVTSVGDYVKQDAGDLKRASASQETSPESSNVRSPDDYDVSALDDDISSAQDYVSHVRNDVTLENQDNVASLDYDDISGIEDDLNPLRDDSKQCDDDPSKLSYDVTADYDDGSPSHEEVSSTSDNRSMLFGGTCPVVFSNSSTHEEMKPISGSLKTGYDDFTADFDESSSVLGYVSSSHEINPLDGSLKPPVEKNNGQTNDVTPGIDDVDAFFSGGAQPELTSSSSSIAGANPFNDDSMFIKNGERLVEKGTKTAKTNNEYASFGDDVRCMSDDVSAVVDDIRRVADDVRLTINVLSALCNDASPMSANVSSHCDKMSPVDDGVSSTGDQIIPYDDSIAPVNVDTSAAIDDRSVVYDDSSSVDSDKKSPGDNVKELRYEGNLDSSTDDSSEFIDSATVSNDDINQAGGFKAYENDVTAFYGDVKFSAANQVGSRVSSTVEDSSGICDSRSTSNVVERTNSESVEDSQVVHSVASAPNVIEVSRSFSFVNEDIGEHIAQGSGAINESLDVTNDKNSPAIVGINETTNINAKSCNSRYFDNLKPSVSDGVVSDAGNNIAVAGDFCSSVDDDASDTCGDADSNDKNSARVASDDISAVSTADADCSVADDVSAVVNDVSAVIDDVSAVVNDVSAVVDDVSAVVDDVSPVIDDANAVVDDVSAVADDVNAVVNDVSVVVDDVSAVVDDVSGIGHDNIDDLAVEKEVHVVTNVINQRTEKTILTRNEVIPAEDVVSAFCDDVNPTGDVVNPKMNDAWAIASVFEPTKTNLSSIGAAFADDEASSKTDDINHVIVDDDSQYEDDVSATCDDVTSFDDDVKSVADDVMNTSDSFFKENGSCSFVDDAHSRSLVIEDDGTRNYDEAEEKPHTTIQENLVKEKNNDIDSETDEYVNEDNDYPNYLKQRDYQPETRKQEPPFLGSKDPNETDSSTEESEETIPPSTREENEKRYNDGNDTSSSDVVVELITPNTEVNYPEKRKRSRVTFPDDLPDEPDLVSETSSQFDNIDKSFELSDKVPDFGGASYPGKDYKENCESDVNSDSSNDVSASDIINSPGRAQCIAAKLARLEVNTEFLSPAPTIVELNDVISEFDDVDKISEPLRSNVDDLVYQYGCILQEPHITEDSMDSFELTSGVESSTWYVMPPIFGFSQTNESTIFEHAFENLWVSPRHNPGLGQLYGSPDFSSDSLPIEHLRETSSEFLQDIEAALDQIESHFKQYSEFNHQTANQNSTSDSESDIDPGQGIVNPSGDVAGLLRHLSDCSSFLQAQNTEKYLEDLLKSKSNFAVFKKSQACMSQIHNVSPKLSLQDFEEQNNDDCEDSETSTFYCCQNVNITEELNDNGAGDMSSICVSQESVNWEKVNTSLDYKRIYLTQIATQQLRRSQTIDEEIPEAPKPVELLELLESKNPSEATTTADFLEPSAISKNWRTSERFHIFNSIGRSEKVRAEQTIESAPVSEVKKPLEASRPSESGRSFEHPGLGQSSQHQHVRKLLEPRRLPEPLESLEASEATNSSSCVHSTGDTSSKYILSETLSYDIYNSSANCEASKTDDDLSSQLCSDASKVIAVENEMKDETPLLDMLVPQPWIYSDEPCSSKATSTRQKPPVPSGSIRHIRGDQGFTHVRPKPMTHDCTGDTNNVTMNIMTNERSNSSLLNPADFWSISLDISTDRTLRDLPKTLRSPENKDHPRSLMISTDLHLPGARSSTAELDNSISLQTPKSKNKYVTKWLAKNERDMGKLNCLKQRRETTKSAIEERSFDERKKDSRRLSFDPTAVASADAKPVSKASKTSTILLKKRSKSLAFEKPVIVPLLSLPKQKEIPPGKRQFQVNHQDADHDLVLTCLKGIKRKVQSKPGHDLLVKIFDQTLLENVYQFRERTLSSYQVTKVLARFDPAYNDLTVKSKQKLVSRYLMPEHSSRIDSKTLLKRIGAGGMKTVDSSKSTK